MPRSGTTLLQNVLAYYLNIDNYNEPFTGHNLQMSIKDPYQWASNLSNGVLKVVSHNLNFVNFENLISAGNFDSVVITHRENLTDIIISSYYADKITQQYHYKELPKNITPFIFPLDYIDVVLVLYRQYKETLDNLDKKLIPYTIFDYDKYQTGELQIIAGVDVLVNDVNNKFETISANISYNQVCLNYNEVKKNVEQLIREDDR